MLMSSFAGPWCTIPWITPGHPRLRRVFILTLSGLAGEEEITGHFQLRHGSGTGSLSHSFASHLPLHIRGGIWEQTQS